MVVGTPGSEGLHNVRHHYLWSNERRHDLFFADIAELGGGYLGVGGDQNYTIAARMQGKYWVNRFDGARRVTSAQAATEPR